MEEISAYFLFFFFLRQVNCPILHLLLLWRSCLISDIAPISITITITITVNSAKMRHKEINGTIIPKLYPMNSSGFFYNNINLFLYLAFINTV